MTAVIFAHLFFPTRLHAQANHIYLEEGAGARVSNHVYAYTCEAINIDYNEPYLQLVVQVNLYVNYQLVDSAYATGFGYVSAVTGTSFPATPYDQRVDCYSFTTLGGLYDADIAPGVPDGESTDGCYWGIPSSVCKWWQTLQPSNGGYGGRSVEETDGGGGYDTCYFPGSSVPRSESITGGQWPVHNDNRWYYDAVGWWPFAVEYYRNEGVVPCDTQFYQVMEIDWSTGESTYWIPYRTNLLRMGITVTTVWSERDGRYAERVWP